MKYYRCLLSFVTLLLFWGKPIVAQTERIKLIGAEVGVEFQFSDDPDLDFIRGEVSSYYNGQENQVLSMFYNRIYSGVKCEIRNKTNRIGLISGLRFTQNFSSLGKSNNWESNSDYFYFRLSSDDQTTRYLTINEINETSSYIGIPLEVRYFLYEQHKAGLFLKGGFDFNYRLSTSRNVRFNNSESEVYSSNVLAMFGQPDDFYSSFLLSAGIKLGKDDGLNATIEITAPVIPLTQHPSGLFSSFAGAGIQINVLLPF